MPAIVNHPFLCCIPRAVEVYLRLIVDFLRNLILENLGGLGPLQDLVLPEGQESLQQVLAQREPNQDGLPWEEWAVQETRELLYPRQEINDQSSFTKYIGTKKNNDIKNPLTSRIYMTDEATQPVQVSKWMLR